MMMFHSVTGGLDQMSKEEINEITPEDEYYSRLPPNSETGAPPWERRARREEISEDVFLYHSRPAPALLVHVDGSMEVVNLTSEEFTLEQLENIIGGPVEWIAAGNFALVISEEVAGKEPKNELATIIGLVGFPKAKAPEEIYIVGTALLCPRTMIPTSKIRKLPK